MQAGLGALATAQQLAAQAVPAGRRASSTRASATPSSELAQLIKGGANVRVATIGMGGYDTHENQGTRAGGYLYRPAQRAGPRDGRVLRRPRPGAPPT